ncbi:hypothetical protein HID58_089084 [Brassica napus]|uniref:Uncharacterized protein n=1 Tax=Brassica napus TaxID=3708 RepID=A0ABQ7XY05_BRANA|nr:hypothetical protein HID58_089084 [Brassica napus]
MSFNMETKPRRRISSCNRESLLPKRSTLMSKTRLSKQEDGSMRCCLNAGNLSASIAKFLGIKTCPARIKEIVSKSYRKCSKSEKCNNCKHLIEPSGGCYHVDSRSAKHVETIGVFVPLEIRQQNFVLM